MNSDDNHVLYYTNLIGTLWKHTYTTHLHVHTHTQNHNGDTAEAEENSVKIYSNVV